MILMMACGIFIAATSLTGLAVEGAHGTTIKVEKLVQSSQSWDGSPLPAYPSGTPEIQILKITIPPKTQLARHYHTVINAGVLLSGQLTVVKTGSQKTIRKLKAGEPLVELVNAEHYGVNESAEAAVILVFYASEKGKAITVKTED